MHFLAALENPSLRSVLVLFEGVATGAADGWYRMSGRPASTLLHLGPGLANGLANLHNARRAGSGIVNIIGEHATAHLKYDPPLMSDIEGLARPISHWVRRVEFCVFARRRHFGSDKAGTLQARANCDAYFAGGDILGSGWRAFQAAIDDGLPLPHASPGAGHGTR